jgi:hypothetical protein
MITVNTWPFSQACIGCRSAVFIPVGFGDCAYLCRKAVDADGDDCPAKEEATMKEWQDQF